MINMDTTFEVSMFTHYKNMKGNAKCRKRVVWGEGVKGHHSIEHTTSYSTLIEIMHQFCSVFEL